jgi:hypothetical protein
VIACRELRSLIPISAMASYLPIPQLRHPGDDHLLGTGLASGLRPGLGAIIAWVIAGVGMLMLALVTLLSYGILPRADFAALRQPSMASLPPESRPRREQA